MHKKADASSDKIGSNAMLLTGSKMLVMLISLITSMLLSRFRSLEEYGTYSQLLIVVNIATAVFMLGLPNSLSYFYARADSTIERDKFLSNYYSLVTVLSVIAGIVLCLIIPILKVFFSNTSIYLYWFILAFLPWSKVLINSRGNMLVAAGQTNRVIPYNIMNGIFLLVIVVLVRVTNLSFYWYMILYILVEVFFGFVVYLDVSSLSSHLKFELDKQQIKLILKYAFPIGLATSISTINKELDKMVIGNLMGTEQLAIYSNAAKELPLVFIQQSFLAVLLPSLARMIKKGQNKKATETWGHTIEFSFIFMAFFVSAILVFAPQIMTVLYSEKYLPGANIFRIYGLVLLWRTTYFGMILNVTGHSKKIMYSSIFSLILNLILNYTFYFLFGMIGPAISTFLSVGIVNVSQLIFSSKIVKVPMKCIFPWKNLMKIFIINLIMTFIMAVLMKTIGFSVKDTEIIYCILIGITWMGVYLILMKKRLKEIWGKINS